VKSHNDPQVKIYAMLKFKSRYLATASPDFPLEFQ